MKDKEHYIKELKEFDDAFEDGVYAVPSGINEPKVKVRALYDYCQKNGVTPDELSNEDMKIFLTRKTQS